MATELNISQLVKSLANQQSFEYPFFVLRRDGNKIYESQESQTSFNIHALCASLGEAAVSLKNEVGSREEELGLSLHFGDQYVYVKKFFIKKLYYLGVFVHKSALPGRVRFYTDLLVDALEVKSLGAEIKTEVPLESVGFENIRDEEIDQLFGGLS